LGYAAKYGKKEMVQYLLEQGADPNLPVSPSWAKPLAWANRRGYKEITDLLKATGAVEN
jgi:ankyrin repeat protein